MAEFSDGTYEIIGCAMEVHRKLGPGLREKPYENALVIALRRQKIKVEQQRAYPIKFDDEIVGDCAPDLTVGKTILIEVKSVETLGDAETAQLLNYLRISTLRTGLLINFKKPKLEWKRLVM